MVGIGVDVLKCFDGIDHLINATDSAQGDKSSIEFPSGPIEFTTSRDEGLGTYLTAVLFRSVSDMPDQETARAIAQQVMNELFVPARDERALTRRDLLTGLRGR